MLIYLSFGTPGENRTHNGPLGGGCYIHLTTEAYATAFIIHQSISKSNTFKKNKKLRDPLSPTITEAETPQVTPSKLPHGTRKLPLRAATFLA